MTVAETSPPPSDVKGNAHTWRSLIVPAVIILTAVLLLLLITAHWDRWRSTEGIQKTNDAYMRADIVPLSTRITGTLREVSVSDYQQVQAGQLIAKIDPADSKASLAEAESALTAAQAQFDDNQVQKRVQLDRIAQAREGEAQGHDAILVASGQRDTSVAQTVNASQERRRQEALYVDAATTRQMLERAVAVDNSSQATLASAEAGVQKATDARREAHTLLLQAQGQLRLLNSRDADLQADINQRLAAVAAAQVQLNYTEIHAPVAGFVTEKTAFPGQLMTPGTEVIALVEGALWIQANFEETQLGSIRLGDSADVRIDAVPAHVFHGHVWQFAPASGSQTALLPPDNATGNFTKVIQRIPVRIILDTSDATLGRLRPGFSCEVAVHVSGGR